MALRDLHGTVYKTLSGAEKACAQIDKRLGLPNAHMERWTIPIELDDGTYLVQSPRGEKGDAIDVKRIKVVPE